MSFVVAGSNVYSVELGLLGRLSGYRKVVTVDGGLPRAQGSSVPRAPSSLAAEGRRAVEEARRRGVLLTVYQNRRWDGDFRTVRRLLTAGALGDVLLFE